MGLTLYNFFKDFLADFFSLEVVFLLLVLPFNWSLQCSPEVAVASVLASYLFLKCL